MRNSGETPRNLDLVPKFLGEPVLCWKISFLESKKSFIKETVYYFILQDRENI